MNVKDCVVEQIKEVAAKYGAQKVILYGSRARGDHSPVSDYDIAVFDDKFTLLDQARFYSDIEEIDTLKKIDVTFTDGNSRSEFMQTVKEEGVIIYEQTIHKAE